MPSRVRLTAGRIAALTCPPGKSQAFTWDTEAPALLVRVTPSGRKTFVFEARLHGETVRITIGDVASWTLEAARQRAQDLKRHTDNGIDPRELARQQAEALAAAKVQAAADAAQQAEAERAATLTVGEAWSAYLVDRRYQWSDRHYSDHVALAKAGGERVLRGKGKTIAGPLHPFMAKPLSSLSAEVVEAWAKREAKTRPTRARLAWRLLRAFLNWCGEHEDYATLVTGNPAKTKRAREALGKPRAKQDALLREQLPAWFAAVRQIENPGIAAALQFMLLTGCRLNECLALRWEDVNTKGPIRIFVCEAGSFTLSAS